ncbi:MAG TPA: phosphotransferase [Pyrinomonadaceae bacterium]|nr:phosphotransferase [Pyrinomonadaceae bacterium]
MIIAVLQEYAIFDADHVLLTPMAGGYLNRMIRVDHGGKSYTLRRYQFNKKYGNIEYEHWLLNSLPSVLHNAKLAKPLRSMVGKTLAHHGTHMFALFPYLLGDEFDRSDVSLLGEAGRTLAAYHNAVFDLVPKPKQRLGFGSVTCLDWVARHAGSVSQVIKRNERCVSTNFREAEIQRRLRVLQEEDLVLRQLLGRPAYAGLPHLVIHNDLGPQNLLTQGGHVVALLDFDLACWDSRAYDLATSLMWFSEDNGLDPPYQLLHGDRSWRRNEARGKIFFDAYVEALVRPLTQVELTYLPLLMRVFLLWTGIWYLDRRLRGIEWYPEEVSGLLSMYEWFRRHAYSFSDSITSGL